LQQTYALFAMTRHIIAPRKRQVSATSTQSFPYEGLHIKELDIYGEFHPSMTNFGYVIEFGLIERNLYNYLVR